MKAGKLDREQVDDRLQEFAQYFHGTIDPHSASTYAVTFLVASGSSKDLKGITPAALAGNADLAGYGDLRRLLMATLQYKTGDYTALAKTDLHGLDPARPDAFDTLRMIAFGRIRSGDVAGARDLLKTLLHKDAKDYGLRMALAKSYETAGNLLDAFTDPLVVDADNPNFQFDDVARDLVSLLTDDELLRLAKRLHERATSASPPSVHTNLLDFVKLVLYRHYITMKRYKAFGTAYATLGDAGSVEQFDAHVAAIQALAKNPQDPDSALDVGEFLQQLNANRTEFETDEYSSAAMGTWFSTRMKAMYKTLNLSEPMSPYQYYLITMNVYHRKGMRGNAEAEALHDLIMCFKPHEYGNDCTYDGGGGTGNPALWFKRLHIKYKDSPQAADTPYYY